MSKNIKKNKILIIGAGPVGCTAAEILSKKSFNVKIVDSRNHLAGNCYDFKNEYGILVHKYGPHYFRTNNKNIINYLSKFTKWIPGNYRVNSYVDKQYYEFLNAQQRRGSIVIEAGIIMTTGIHEHPF